MADHPIVPVMRCENCGRSTLEHCDAHGHACCPTQDGLTTCPGQRHPPLTPRHRFAMRQPRRLVPSDD